jgi:hypothetical protein
MARKRNDIEVEDVTGTSQYDGMQVLKDAHSLPGHYIRTKESLTLVKANYDTFDVTYNSSDNPTQITYFAGTKPHVTTIGFTGDSNGDKASGYVLLSSGRNKVKYALYMTVDNIGTPPSLEGVINIEVPLLLNDSANIVAAAYDNAISSIGSFSVSRSNAVLEISTKELGISNNTSEVGTGFIIQNTSGEQQEVEKVTLTYGSNNDPIWQGQELKGHRYNVYKGMFEKIGAITKDSNNNDAIRVINVSPSDDDISGPTSLLLNNNTEATVEENQPQGTLVGTLTVKNGLAPIVYTIEQDLGNAFQIVNNELQTSRNLDFSTEPSLNCSVRATDANGNFTISNFLITVIPVEGFLNNFSYKFNGSSFINIPQRITPSGSGIGNNMTVGFWFKMNEAPTVPQTLFDSTNESDISGIKIIIEDEPDNSTFRVIVSKGNGNTKDYRYNFDDFNYTDWNLIGISLNTAANDIRLYFNGILRTPWFIPTDENISSSNFNSSSNTYYGASSDQSDFVEGLIDEMFIADAFFSSAQWSLAYNNGSSTDITQVSSDITHWYRAETDSLPVIEDVVGSANGASVQVTKSGNTPTGFNNNFAVEFDGVSNFFLGSGVPDLTSAKSFSFWVKRDTPLQTDILIGFNSSTTSNNNAARIYFDSNSQNRIYFRIDSPSGDIIRRWQLGSETIGVYTHICITASDFTDATTVNLYENGILVAANQTTNSLTTLPTIANNLSIGAGSTGGSKIVCYLDEYSVWNKELTLGEVQEIYNLGSSKDLKTVSVSDDLIQWWRFGDKNNRQAVMNDEVGSGAMVMIGYDINFYVASEV